MIFFNLILQVNIFIGYILNRITFELYIHVSVMLSHAGKFALHLKLFRIKWVTHQSDFSLNIQTAI